jgi:hypothetical protein
MAEWQNIDHFLLQLNQQLSALEKLKLREQLVFFVNHLILHDFNRLTQILYTVDVSEQKLKTILQEKPQTDSAELIADLLIERQEQKIASKNSFKSNNNISEDELW